MSCPVPDIIAKRLKSFRPTKFKVVLLAVSDFTLHNPRKIAEQSIDREVYKSELRKVEKNRLAKIPGDIAKTRIERARLQVEDWVADPVTRENMIVEMTERISKVQTPGNLPATVDDIRNMYKFVTLNLGIPADDITVMATEADREKIIY